jgi:hypothetical protein
MAASTLCRRRDAELLMALLSTSMGLAVYRQWQQEGQSRGSSQTSRRPPDEATRFDRFAPAMAARLRDIDARFAKTTKGRFTLSPVMDDVRAAIANEGFAGLERLGKKYGIPAMALAAALAELQEAQSPGPTGSDAGILQ